MTKQKIFINKIRFSRNLLKTINSSLFISSILLFSIYVIRKSGNLQFLELAAFDSMMRWEKIESERSQKQKLSESRITLVGIGESDIQTWQQSTFSDELIAKLIAKLQKHNPKVIGLDIYRDIPQPPGNQQLRQQLEAENVIVVANVDKDGGVPPPPNAPRERIGFNNLLLDFDGTVRRNFMSAKLGDIRYYSFGFQLSKNYLDSEEKFLDIQPNYLKLDRAIFPALKADSGGYQLAKSDVYGSQILLQYQPLNNIVEQISFTQILEGDFEPRQIENKIIIIGYTAPSKKDIFSTPYGVKKMSGVAIHAQMTAQILSAVLDERSLFKSIPQWGEMLWIWIWSLGGATLVWRTQHPLALGIRLTIATGSLFIICLGLFFAAIWIPFVPAAIGLIATAGLILAYKTFYKSVVDELTGLANRNKIVTVLEQSIVKPKNSLIAVISIKIERFNTINDSLGQNLGDRIIILSGKRIKNCIRPQDCLARVETAKFVLTLLTLETNESAVAIAKRIQQELAQMFIVEGQEVSIATNLGIAFHDLGDKTTAQELLRNSNIAQDRARILGKNHYAVFTPKMYSESVAQWQLERDLRRAIAEEEFELYYQPIIDLESERIAGFEALVRWISPTRGFVSPGEFIPLAEATDLIIPLGDWILRTACQQMYRWHQQFALLEGLTISINLSSHQFSPNLVSQVEQILEETKLIPQYLKLEITESAMMDNVKEAISLLQQLKTLNIKLSIDDFGTGYSSLSYLQQFSADTLKIDRSFVMQMESSDKDKAIVDIIITLAHKLDMNVIAEGIETENHEQILKALNCEYGQGYFFAKPLKVEDATKFLKQQFDCEL